MGSDHLFGNGAVDARSYDSLSLPDLLYRNMRQQCPDDAWWEKFEPTIRSMIYSDVLGPAPPDDDDGRGIRLDGNKSFLLYTEPMQYFINQGVTEFLDTAGRMGYRTDIRLHRPSSSKTDIGYRPEEVAITLAYARDGSATNFLVFTRNSPQKIGAKIPRSVLKRIAGTTDIMAAARQAERNLSGRMRSGGMGPFGLTKRDMVYFDRSSYLEGNQNPRLLVNFSTGFDMLSFNMGLVGARYVIDKLYGSIIEVEDLWSSWAP